MKLIQTLFFSTILILSGCASAPLTLSAKSESQVLTPPPVNKAQIIFLNPSNAVAGPYFTGIYEIKNGDKELLGMLGMGAKTKMVINVDPGRHLFMAHMVRYSHFLDGNVEAGKRYYVLLRFKFANGHQLRPIRSFGSSEFSVNNPNFEKWKNETVFVVKTKDADTWYAENKNIVDESQAKGWAEWQKKNPEQKAELTLNKEDYVEK
jgi:hypothetical protein